MTTGCFPGCSFAPYPRLVLSINQKEPTLLMALSPIPVLLQGHNHPLIPKSLHQAADG